MCNKKKYTREDLIEMWSKCEFGVKTRVFEMTSKRRINYILSTPSYQDSENQIKDIVICIKKAVKELKKDVTVMVEEINKV